VTVSFILLFPLQFLIEPQGTRILHPADCATSRYRCEISDP
jgi:hypothetical protein